MEKQKILESGPVTNNITKVGSELTPVRNTLRHRNMITQTWHIEPYVESVIRTIPRDLAEQIKTHPWKKKI